MLIGLDTNILVYALTTQDERKQRISAQILRRALRNPQEYAVSIQVLAETVNVIGREAPDVLPEALRLVDLLSRTLHVLYYTPAEIQQAATGPPKHFWDRLLAYTYRNNGVTEIITEDERTYKGIIQTRNPFRAQL